MTTVQTPLPSQKTYQNQEHNTVGTHFTMFEVALDPLWPFPARNKYICGGAQNERANPNENTTPFPQMPPNSRASGAAPFAQTMANTLNIPEIDILFGWVDLCAIKAERVWGGGGGAEMATGTSAGNFCGHLNFVTSQAG